MGLSQALNTSTVGMRTTQAGLAIVAGNVANSDTAGYVRKTVGQQSTAAGDLAVSVKTTGINRELDTFVQRQFRIESSGGAYADLKSQFYSRLQSIYGTPGSPSSLETLFNNFTGALQALTANPSDYSTRTGVIGTGQALTQQLNRLSGQIQALRSDAELGIADAVRTANDALQRIAQLNGEIAASPANDASTANLLDQRDQYIDKLATLMDIRVVDTGNRQISIFTASGIELVGARAAQLSFNAQGTITPGAQWNADPVKSQVGTITLTVGGSSSVDLISTNTFHSGQIAAYIELRDKILVQAQSQLDEFAAAAAQALSDQTVTGTPATAGLQTGFDIDTGSLQAGNSVRLNYTDTLTGAVHNLTFVRVDDPSALPLANTATVDPNDKVIGIDWSGGIVSVVNQLNALFAGRVQFSNPSGTTLRVLDDGGAGTTDINSASATSTVSSISSGVPQLPFFTDGPGLYTGAISGSGSQKTGFAGRISINQALVADPSGLVKMLSATPSGDLTRPNFINDQLTSATLNYSAQSGLGTTASPFSGSLPTFLRQIISQQGDAAQAAKSLSDGQAVVVDALQQRLNETSGVNIDQEMSNLVNLQTAYGANARVFTTIKELLDTLLRL
jgi:flagellar hook-associated protein 1 FlgK